MAHAGASSRTEARAVDRSHERRQSARVHDNRAEERRDDDRRTREAQPDRQERPKGAAESGKGRRVDAYA